MSSKCANKLCERQASDSEYCCPPCELAATKRYEIHESGPLGHSSSCNFRNIDRGECTPTEAVLLSQERK